MQANWPFMVMVASHAPHGPATPAPWYADLYSTADVIAPRTPSFNVSAPDKHWIVYGARF
jgi:N-acetylglucosamine-6-sulfatase